MNMVSIHCTHTLVGTTLNVGLRSRICRRVRALCGDCVSIPRLEFAVSGPVLSGSGGRTLLAATLNGGPSRLDGGFVTLMLGRSERDALRFVTTSCVALCEGRGGVVHNGLVATATISTSARSGVHGVIRREARNAIRFGARIGPRLVNNFVLRCSACEVSTDMGAGLGGVLARLGGWGWLGWVAGYRVGLGRIEYLGYFDDDSEE